MPRIKLFLMRHGKSCSNHVRSSDLAVSKEIRDPGLSALGSKSAQAYGPTLRRTLADEGFDLDGAIISASTLRRAQDTARIVFGRDRITTMPHFAENGNILENTPTDSPYAAPDWSRFVTHLSSLASDGDSVVVVGHGSFLLSLWPTLTGKNRDTRLNNLDGILLDADIGPHGLRTISFKELRAPPLKEGADKCNIQDTRKINAASRIMTTQRGGNGSAGMHPGFFNDGAQMRGTSGEATGVGLAGASSGWVRTPLGQTGGKRRVTRKQRTRRRSQRGGFVPSVMGGFATNGLRLLPIAGYMGYKMYSNQRKTRKHARGSRRR